jgi:hypothetical protein
VVGRSFGAGRLYGADKILHRIDAAQDGVDDARRCLERGVTQSAQHVFAGMSKAAQLGKAKKAAGSLYGMEYAKQRRYDGQISWLRFQAHQLAIQTSQGFGCFDQEILDQIIHTPCPGAHAKRSSTAYQTFAKKQRV